MYIYNMSSDIIIDVDNKLYYFDENIIPCITGELIYKDKYNQLLHTKNILNLVYTKENKYKAINKWQIEGSNNIYETIKLTCITAYSWPDNDPSNSGNIAYNKDAVVGVNSYLNPSTYSKDNDYPAANIANFKRNAMGGTGTYEDPITIAVPQYNYAECGLESDKTLKNNWQSNDFCKNNSKSESKESDTSWIQKANLEAGNIYYMPYFQKYFVVEDQCDITARSNFCAPNHFDIYIGPPTKDDEYEKNKKGIWKVKNPSKIKATNIRNIEYQFSWPVEGWTYCPKTNDEINYAINRGSYLTAYKIINGKALPEKQYPVNTKSFYDQFSDQTNPVVFCDPPNTSTCKSPYVDNSGGPLGKLTCPKDKSRAICGGTKGSCGNCDGMGFLCADGDGNTCCPNNPCN